MLVTEVPDLFVNFVQDFAGFFETFFVRAGEFRWIWKRPMQTRRYPGKDRTTGGLGFIANRNYVREQLAGYEDVEDGLRFVFGNIDPDFFQHLHRERVQFTRLQSGAFRFEKLATPLTKQRRCHLAARAVVNTNEQNFLLHSFLGATSFVFIARRLKPQRSNSLLPERTGNQRPQ